MAYPGTYHIHRKERYFASVQSSLTVAADEAAADGFEAMDLTISPIHAVQEREDSRRGRDLGAKVNFERGPHGFQISKYFLPSGSDAAPDDDPLLDCLFEKSTRATVTVTSSPATTGFVTADTGILSAGDLLFVPLTASSDEGVWAAISTVTAGSGVETIVFVEALGFTPALTTVCPASIQYEPKDDLDTDKFITLTKLTPVDIEKIAGCCPTELKITGERGNKTMMTYTGVGRRHFGMAEARLSVSLTDVATSMTMSPPVFGVDASHPVYVQIESEVVKITAVSGTTHTIVRAQKSTSAVAHTAPLQVYPYAFTPSTAGDPVAGVTGRFLIGGTAMSISKFDISLPENFAPVVAYGSDELTGFVAAAYRAPSISAECIATVAAASLIWAAYDRSEYSAQIEIGKTVSKSMAIRFPRVVHAPIPRPAAPGDKVPIAYQSVAVLGTGSNSYRLAICGAQS